MAAKRRTPRGVRGLKYMGCRAPGLPVKSHPSRGAWIEIPLYVRYGPKDRVAPLAGCVD